MRKVIILLSLFVSIVGCNKRYEKLNTNPKAPVTVSGQFLYSDAQKNLMDAMVSTNVNLNVMRLYSQYWTETTYPQESRYDLITRQIPDNFWTALYTNVLQDCKTAKSLISEDKLQLDEGVRSSQIATIDILQCYTYYVLTTIYGNIPYTQSLDINILQSKYDDASSIYSNLITRLDSDIVVLNSNSTSFPHGDIIYGGNNANWVKFAATLNMKIAILIADANNSLAQSTFESNQANAILSAADNAIFQYLSVTPNNNPLSNDMNPILTKRNDFVVANTILDYMDSLSDPRLSHYAKPVSGNYIGGIYGQPNTYSSFSHVNSSIYSLSAKAVLSDYSEVEFMLAEAKERGWNVIGSAEDHYKAGVTASILYWGGSATDASTYLASAKVAYSTASGTWKEKIGMQQWIAFYNRGFEGWTSWRRLDAPLFNIPQGLTYNDIPKRYTYPIFEQNLNVTNYNAASSAIGGDLKTTKLFWDKY